MGGFKGSGLQLFWEPFYSKEAPGRTSIVLGLRQYSARQKLEGKINGITIIMIIITICVYLIAPYVKISPSNRWLIVTCRGFGWNSGGDNQDPLAK